MSKIIQYLNDNLAGEVLDSPWIRLKAARDRSILRIIPEAVVLPRQTTDIRKVVKFSHQLAAKGKIIKLTPRGKGHDKTGGAIGDGLVIDLAPFMNRILDIDPSQGLIHVQAGATLPTINAAAEIHQLELPADVKSDNTAGGMIGANHVALNRAKITDTFEMIDQLEVILSNGDAIHARQLSKSELNKKMGQSDFEGEIYRKLDNLIEAQSRLIDSIDTSKIDNFGYSNIADIKKPNGSFNLTPLLIGSQGTLGIISEAILKLDIKPAEEQILAAAFVNLDDALDAAEEIIKLKPDFVDIFHSGLFIDAMEKGKSYDFYDQALESFGQTPAVCLIIGVSGKNKRQVGREVKKIDELIKKSKGFSTPTAGSDLAEMRALRDLPTHFKPSSGQDIPLAHDLFIPIFRFRVFYQELLKLEQQLALNLPFYGSIMSGVINIRTILDLKQVGDKQKAFRILGLFAKLTSTLDGVYCSGGAEGRLKAPFAEQQLPDELKRLYSDIKNIFDPRGILNPDVKQAAPLKTIIAQTVNDYNNGVFY